MFSILFAAYIYIYWLPYFLNHIEDNNKQRLTAHLNSVAEVLVPFLLENRLANVYDNLDLLLKKNKGWVQIKLYNKENTLLYPLVDVVEPSEASNMYTLQQSIDYFGHNLGRLMLTVDISDDIEQVHYIQQLSLVVLLILLGIFLFGSSLILEFFVRKPINQLSTVSDRIAKGDFAVALPKSTGDEIGRLVNSFSQMRDAIQSHQRNLKREVENHKETALQLFHEKERVSYHACHDDLTGLINRREFENRLRTAIEQAKMDNVQHVLFYMDLDQFKVVNDTCGHTAGDELLRQVASLLRQKARKGDTLARLGGDEFGVLLEACQIDDALNVVRKFHDVVQRFRFRWHEQIFTIGISIGVVPFCGESQDLESILSAADSACYAAKEKGRNQIHVYKVGDEEMNKRYGEMQWISRLTKALEENRFVLYCQPIVPAIQAANGEKHLEILLRLQEEDGTIIPPGAFIPAAERYKLIASIDRWVVQQLFNLLSGIYRQGQLDKTISYAVNLSGASLSDGDFLEFIREQFQQHPHLSKMICFEITETAAIANLGYFIQFIDEFKKRGCRFSLDDFGSGLSSFAYLKELPVNYLKIDGMFVKDIAEDPIHYAMVKSINEVGQVMGMQTIAEFVENDAALEKLQEIGVDYAQGYGIRKPYPLAQEFLSNSLPNKSSPNSI